MKQEHQVSRLELSRKLRELGVKQESIFVWEYFNDQCYGLKYIPFAVIPHESNNVQLFSAFTVAELSEMLPCMIGTVRMHDKSMWMACYESDNICFSETPTFKATNQADCLANILIYLIENNLIKL